MSVPITRLSASDLAAKLRAREVSATEVARAYLDRIQGLDSQFGAYLTITEELAMNQAAKAQALLDAEEGGPLTGIPFALKDNISTLGIRTTCGSWTLGNYFPPFDAHVAERLAKAGAVLLGKTNLDEFAMGTSTENSAYQLTRNPWDTECSPGGSSGGSAAAVAAELAAISFGSDTGGSIRQPASLCGIVGFKPTYGRVSRYGLVAFASSLDQIGPFGKSVEDVALAAEVISGHDDRDSTSLPGESISSRDLKSGSLRGLKVGVPREFFGDSMHEGVLAQVHGAVDVLRREGVEFEEISLPSIQFGVTTYYIIAPAEASSNLARFDGVRYGLRAEGTGHIGVVERSRAEGFGHEVKARIMIGTYALSAGYYDAFYVRAQQVRALMQREFNEAFQKFDLILGPTSPVPAFKIGELSADPIQLKLLDYCTIPANMLGCPALSLNCGLTGGLPVGLHLMAAPLRDESLLQAAFSIERAMGASVRPPVP